MQVEVRSFNKFLRVIERAELGTGIENAGIEKSGKNRGKIIVKGMTLLDSGTDFVQTQLIESIAS